jgi:DNA-binding helix-hairpin-helix protein with protein kinase domain
MRQLLQENQIVSTELSGLSCRIGDFLGGGTQGEVYRADLGGKEVALKWYFPAYLRLDPDLRARLERSVKSGPPDDRFLWPLELAHVEGVEAFGYVMPLREQRFHGIVDLMRRRVNPSFRALATAGFQLAQSYWQLHSAGLCYRDINFNNVFFDPDSGEVRICDNDNVDINGQPGAISGTPSFMAPEIVRGEAAPSRATDLHSLAVLLFYMYIVHHPMHGRLEYNIHALDLPARRRLYGEKPVFIFDPHDSTNRPVPDCDDHQNPLAYWPIYPRFLQNLFIEAFTVGLHDPNKRVGETMWMPALVRLRDSAYPCPRCSAENFYDRGATRAGKVVPGRCWSCGQEPYLPARIRIERRPSTLGYTTIMLNRDTQLYPHHLDGDASFDFSRPVAEVAQHPKNPRKLGLKNLGEDKWVATSPDGTMRDVPPGRSLTLATGWSINFGRTEGRIRV